MSDAEFECRKCGKVVSSKQYGLDRFCPDCGTLLQLRPPPKYWIFQFNPATYAWFDWIKENRETEQWLTSRHAGDIREGDKVAIWASGEKAGVYAVSEVLSNPRRDSLNPAQKKHWTKKAEEDVYKFQLKRSVIVRYLRIITDRPVLEAECIKDSILCDVGVLKQPQGTNFPVIKEQWNRIFELVTRKA